MIDPTPLINTTLIATIGGLITWTAQDLRKRLSNVERRMGHTITALFYIVTAPDERRRYPVEARQAIAEAMKEIK